MVSMVRIILDRQKILALQRGVYHCQISERILERQLLFDLGYVSSLYAGTEEERRKGGVLAAGFFPFQMETVKQINSTNSQLIEVPASVLYEAAGFDPKQSADNKS